MVKTLNIFKVSNHPWITGNQRTDFDPKRKLDMQCLISHMTSVDDLKAYRRYAASVLAEHLGSPIKGRKLDEITAQLAGARDWNTAVGMLNKQQKPVLEPDSYKLPSQTQTPVFSDGLVLAWDAVIRGLVAGNYISETDKDLMMDEAVDDLVGTSQWISDNVNNQGQFVQLVYIKRAMSLPLMWARVSKETGVTEAHLKFCVERAREAIMNDPTGETEPFDIHSVTQY